MPTRTSLAIRRERSPSAYTMPERRLHKRFPLKLAGRFMRANQEEYACELIDISVGGMAVSSPVQPQMGESLIAYMDELGGLEGKVARVFDGGFAVSFTSTSHKRDKLAARITWLINQDELAGLGTRTHERKLMGKNSNTLKLSDEITLQVQIIDVSLSGANIATEARPPLGSVVQLGKLHAQVIRHHPRGIGVRFISVQEPDAIKNSFS